MLRAPSDRGKENPVRVRGCQCNTNRARLHHATLPPLAPHALVPELFNSTVLRDVASQTNVCRSTQRQRSKSSNEGNIQRLVAVAPNPRKALVAPPREAPSYDPYGHVQRVVTKNPSAQKVASYNHIVKKEMQEILVGDRQHDSSMDRSSRSQTKSTISLNSTMYYSFDVYEDTQVAPREVSGSQRLSVRPTQQLRSHSCSSIASEDDTRDYGPSCEGRKENLQRYHGQYQKNKHYTSGLKAKTDENLITPIPSNPKNKIRQNVLSPILPNRFTSQNTLISKMPEEIRKPKLKKRASRFLNRPYGGDIYNEEYLYDILVNIKRQEPEITLEGNFFQSYNPNTKFRAGVVNWLLKEQARLNFSESEYYLAVNLLDHVLASTAVPTNMYQLVIMSTIWISMKLIGCQGQMASDLIGLCNGAYLAEQLIKMERRVLKIMDFKIHTTEPSLCVNYYLKLFKLQDNNLAKLSIYYIMDCFSLTPQFSSTPVSVLAAACVKYTLTKYYEEKRERVLYIFMRILSKEDIDEMNYVEALIYMQLVNMADENYVFKEPYYKYSRRKGNINTDKTVNF